MLRRPLDKSSTALYAPTNFPSTSVRFTPYCFKASIVSPLCTRVKIVLRPVAIVSALSRVVARILVNTAINSFNACVPSLTPLLAEENTPPVR